MRTAAAIILATGLLAAPASAQRDTGQYGAPIQTPENMARSALIRSSFCARGTASATARKLLQTAIASAEEAKAARSLRAVAPQCYEPQWPAFAPTSVRNAVAEVTYRAEHRSAPAPTPADAKLPDSFSVTPGDTQTTPEQEAARYLGALANCVVFVDPPAAHNLVVGPSGVPEEIRRYDALQPALAKCTPAGGVPGMKAQLFRGYLADALLMRAQSK